MKITKSQLKQLIVEELSADAELLKTMNKLAGSIDSLDVSIDYLTSTISGEDPFGIDLLQKRFGRFAKPGSKRAASLDEGHGGEGSMAVRQLNNLSQMVQELQAMVDESDDHEEWVESKITKAHDYINTVLNYLSGADPDFNPVNERVYQAGEQRPIDIIKGDLQELLTCYMHELETMGHDADLIAFGMKRVISDIQISGGKGSQCDSVAVRPTVDPTDAPYRRVAERELTDAEEDEKEDIVKGMKKNKKDFKKRYGKDAESVMYGAATNIAKKNRGKK